MSISTKANDWEVTCVMQGGGGAVVGAMGFIFLFSSKKAKINKREFLFVGGGLGAGGTANGASMTPNQMTKIKCSRPFSILDLNNSTGRISTAGAGFVAGGGGMAITAFEWFDGSLFSSQALHGFSWGTGASAFILAGLWRKMR